MRRGPRDCVIYDLETVLRPGIPPKKNEAADAFPSPAAWSIVSIGSLIFRPDYQPLNLGNVHGSDERSKVEAFAGYLESDRPYVVTWNGRRFDAPVLGACAVRFGIPMPWWYGDGKGPRYRYGDQSIDLADYLSDFGAGDRPSLDQMCALIGWPVKADHGSDVAGMFERGEHARIDAYCLGDVVRLGAVFLRVQLLRGRITEREWVGTATRYLAYLEKYKSVRDTVSAVDVEVFVGRCKGVSK